MNLAGLGDPRWVLTGGDIGKVHFTKGASDSVCRVDSDRKACGRAR